MAVVSNGTTLIDNGALDSAVPTGSLILLSTQTASSSSTIDFTSNIDSTYDVYVFKFINIHSSDNGAVFSFQGNASGGSGFNETITSTVFKIGHAEADDSADLVYEPSHDQANGSSFQDIVRGVGNLDDECFSGYLKIYNPSSTTFVKHFLARTSMYHLSDESEDCYTAGYFNTTSAIDEVQFKFLSGTIDSGTIKMYGVK
jgi:hypothetical protein